MGKKRLRRCVSPPMLCALAARRRLPPAAARTDVAQLAGPSVPASLLSPCAVVAGAAPGLYRTWYQCLEQVGWGARGHELACFAAVVRQPA